MAKKKFTDELKEQAEEVKTRVKGLGPLKITLLVLLAIVTILSYVFYGYIFGADNVFAGDFGSEFLNALMGCIPRIVRCIQIVTIVSIITTLILAVITKFFGKSQRSITVARLCCNLIKWVVTVVLVIAVLAIWGVDTTALITGAGVLTLVVGLGMQSLIADVVAGLFIVFENEFNVGDIITVDGFRGEVIAIGIRTTKLKAVGNVKIFNNSDIRSVLNQTTEQSVARTNIDVEYGESLPRIEEIIKEIRTSERRFYQKVTDIFAECSIDYNKNSEIANDFYATIQNKFHYAITNEMAAEIIHHRANSKKEHMGLTSWKHSPEGKILKSDVSIAKNYLTNKELDFLQDIVNMYLNIAENRAKRQIPMKMKDWVEELDTMLKTNRYDILDNKGSISAEQAKEFAENEFIRCRCQW